MITLTIASLYSVHLVYQRYCSRLKYASVAIYNKLDPQQLQSSTAALHVSTYSYCEHVQGHAIVVHEHTHIDHCHHMHNLIIKTRIYYGVALKISSSFSLLIYYMYISQS